MAALVSDIVFATRPNGVTLDTQSSATIHTRYGASARDNVTSPSKGYFDNASDAAVVNAERFALVGTERLAFQCVANQLYTNLDASQQTTTVTVVDALHGINRKMLVAAINLNLDDSTTTFQCYG